MLLKKPPLVLDPLSTMDNLIVLSLQEIEQLEAISSILDWMKPSDDLRRGALSHFDMIFYEADMAKRAFSVCLDVLQRLENLVRISYTQIGVHYITAKGKIVDLFAFLPRVAVWRTNN